MSSQEKGMYTIKAVETALFFLNALCEEEGNFGPTYLSNKLGLDKTSVFRLLATFEKWGYVEQVKSSGHYRVGISAYEVGQKFLSRMKLLSRAKPVMERLARVCDETVYLALLSGADLLLLDKVEGSNPVGIMPLVGKRFSLSSCAAGKVILAFNEEVAAGWAGNESNCVNGDMATIRQRWSSDDSGSMGDGVASLAVPLLNAQKRAVGSLCVVGPQYRFTDEKIQSDLIPHIIAAGQIISSRLGYVSW